MLFIRVSGYIVEKTIIHIMLTVYFLVGLFAGGCSPQTNEPAIITATFAISEQSTVVTATPRVTSLVATPTTSQGEVYIVQPGDTLTSIATTHQTTVQTLSDINNLANGDFLSVGQVIQLPGAASVLTPDLWLISDQSFVRGPSSVDFSLDMFVLEHPNSLLANYTELIDIRQADGTTQTQVYTAIEIVNKVSLDFSIDARILLTLLEYRSGWISQSSVDEASSLYPMGYANANRIGLYRQLRWAADMLNRAYYGRLYRNMNTVEFNTGERLRFSPELNAASTAIQYFLAQENNYLSWVQDTGEQGFLSVYNTYFGSLTYDIDEIVFTESPSLTLPFSADETWFYTGGPHGGWGTGSAWAAIDLAPPDQSEIACYTSAYPVRAVTDGQIVRSNNGAVVIDLDGDGLEQTGWNIFYLHIASVGRVGEGIWIEAGDIIGYAACEGGFSTATHLHLARKYNGHWVPAYCVTCGESFNNLTLSDWEVIGYVGQEYQGEMHRGGVIRKAEQGRLSTINHISWSNTPCLKAGACS